MQVNAPVAVRANNVHVAYDNEPILHGINLLIPQGQCAAIMGENGSGKSTFIKAMVGAAPVTVGNFQFFGSLVGKVPWEHIGYVPQRAAAPAGISSTALEVVRSGTLSSRKWWYHRGSKAAALKALAAVGLVRRQAQAFHLLSGGQQQRVLIARALVRDPKLLIMDEPLAGIDRHSQDELAHMAGTLKEDGRTILLVLHELGPLEPLLDRVITIGAGHIASDHVLGPVSHSSPAAQSFQAAKATPSHEDGV